MKSRLVNCFNCYLRPPVILLIKTITFKLLSLKAGVNAGDGIHYVSMPGSGTAAIADVQHSTNDGTTGRWHFRVDGETDTTCQGLFV